MPNTTTEISVTGCHDCPFLCDATYCNHPKTINDGDVDYRDSLDGDKCQCAPKMCPLRAASITIAYTGDGREPMDPP